MIMVKMKVGIGSCCSRYRLGHTGGRLFLIIHHGTKGTQTTGLEEEQKLLR